MLTRNFENLAALLLEASTTSTGLLPVFNTSGMTRFASSTFSYFPKTVYHQFTTSVATPGISVGTGSTAPSKGDTNLENTITSGISGAVSSTVAGCEASGTPYLEHSVAVTNTGSEPITIAEIGYKQQFYYASIYGAAGNATDVCLLDRTVLDSPITIQAGDTGIIKYTLKTAHATKTKAGVNLVSFTFGADEDVAAMIDAARRGDIDLQTDGGWCVGDYRTIHLDAFTGGGGVSHDAQDIDIVITEFGDYNSCGSLFQFDFVQECAAAQRMNSSNTNRGGYSATEMFTDTLPALADALPSWLKSRLLTFDVLVSEGNQSSNIETVSGNRLALRSEVEVYGTANYSVAGEGEQIRWYKAGNSARQKQAGRTGSGRAWFTRSPHTTSQSAFVYFYNGVSNTSNASVANGVAPFGCI